MNVKKLVAVVLLLCLCFISGVLLGRGTDSNTENSRANGKDFPLLAKRIFIENPNDAIVNFAPLRQELRSYISNNTLDGSLYFEYLPTGTSIRVSGDEEQFAASLFKLPAAMDLYRASELKRIDLDKKVILQEQWLDPGFGDLYKKGSGYELTLRDATKIMLRDSDNTALKAIATSTVSSLRPEERALNALDVDIIQNTDLTVSIGARSYTSFLKCLYFACYLTKDDSQELLNYLTQSSFDNRIRAGIDDKKILVAHKIGVASSSTQSDCGIVYYPKRNYAVCVMLKGQDNETTNKHIAEISRLIYRYIKEK